MKSSFDLRQFNWLNSKHAGYYPGKRCSLFSDLLCLIKPFNNFRHFYFHFFFRISFLSHTHTLVNMFEFKMLLVVSHMWTKEKRVNKVTWYKHVLSARVKNQYLLMKNLWVFLFWASKCLTKVFKGDRFLYGMSLRLCTSLFIVVYLLYANDSS